MAPVRAFVGLGGNLGDVVARITRALAALDALPATRVERCSALYRNPPMGPSAQPYYVNAVAELRTGLDAEALLEHMMAIEAAEDRTRGGDRWGPRTLDLDLLLHGDRRACGARLTLPHPGLHERAFVIHPLAEIAPHADVPGRGRAADLARAVPRTGLERVACAPRVR